MGAQAAALLDAGGPVGLVPPRAPEAGRLRLRAPVPYDLSAVARGHGGVGLAPSAWDGTRLHRVLRLPDGPLPVVVHPDLTVTWSRPTAYEDQVRRSVTDVLALDDDLEELWDACDRMPGLTRVRARGAGRVLRAPTAFEDLVGTLSSTNASYAASRRRVAALVGAGPFPAPDEVVERGEDGLRAAGWGYRAPALLGGRPRPLLLDGWLRRQVPDPAAWASLGRWAGTGLWLTVTAPRWDPAAPSAGNAGRAR